MIFISHDLAVVRNVSDKVAVLYMGKLVEIGPNDALYQHPAHPYTRILLDAVPVAQARQKIVPSADAAQIPSRMTPPSGCRFRSRCPKAQQHCVDVEPELRATPHGQFVACHFPNNQ